MASNKMEAFRFWAQMLMGAAMPVLIWIGGGLLSKLDTIERRLDGYTERVVRIETWMGEGRRYTKEDATRDIGVLSEVLEKSGLVLDDHEGRIRSLEKESR